MPEPLRIEYDFIGDVLTIEGVRYSGDLFRSFGLTPTREGFLYTIINRQDGVVTIQQVQDVELYRRFDLLARAGA